MKHWYLGLGLAAVLAATPIACAEHDDDDDEAGEVAEEADEAGEATQDADQATLRAQARIDEETAGKTALERVAGGTITKAELEKEDGRLIWSFDIKVDGRSGIEEVHVDALTGEIVKTEHETDDDESHESH